MHVSIKDLAPALSDALTALGYGRQDIRVEACESVDGTVGGGDGLRGFVCAVNLTTGERKVVNGSWGGANIFTANPVDGTNGDPMIPLTPSVAVVKGHRGGGQPVWATVYAHPEAVGAGMLPSGEAEEELSERDINALYCVLRVRGGTYRKEEMHRRGVTHDDMVSLASRGYVKINAAGAVSATTKGKNAEGVPRY